MTAEQENFSYTDDAGNRRVKTIEVIRSGNKMVINLDEATPEEIKAFEDAGTDNPKPAKKGKKSSKK